MSSIKDRLGQFASKIKQLIKENLQIVALFIITIFMFPAILYYGLITLLAKDAILKPLIEAEATVLGFFGIIVVYALTSLDNKADRFRQQLFDLSKTGKDEEIPSEFLYTASTNQIKKRFTKGQILSLSLQNTQRRKRRVVRLASASGLYLVVSLLISILILGIGEVMFSFFLSILAVSLFFSSILGIFFTIGDLAKEIDWYKEHQRKSRRTEL